MTRIDPAVSVAAIVAEHPATAAVFLAHGIDFCCHGDAPLRDACTARKEPLAALVVELDAAIRRSPSAGEDLRAMSLPALVERIVGRHHSYLRTALPFLERLTAKVARAHADRDPKLVDLDRAFRRFKATVEPHLASEEHELFPALLDPKKTSQPKLEKALAVMVQEHHEVGGLLHQLRDLAGGYLAPPWACTTYRLLLDELQRLESDMLRHLHAENHVLRPKATETRAVPASAAGGPPAGPRPAAPSRRRPPPPPN